MSARKPAKKTPSQIDSAYIEQFQNFVKESERFLNDARELLRELQEHTEQARLRD